MGNVLLQLPELVIIPTNAMRYSERSSYRTIWNTRFIPIRSHERQDARFCGGISADLKYWINYIDVPTALIAKMQHII